MASNVARVHPYAEFHVLTPVFKGRRVGSIVDEKTGELIPVFRMKCRRYEKSESQCSVCGWREDHPLHG